MIPALFAQLFGKVTDMHFDNMAAARDYEFGESAARAAYQRQLDFWNKQNEYNSPLQQRQRIAKAGLSPGLMYSGGAAGSSNAGGLSPVQGNSYASSHQGPSGAGYMSNVLNSMLIESQANKNNAEAEAARANAGLSPGLKADNITADTQSKQSSAEYNVAMSHFTRAKTTGQELDNWIRTYTASDTVQQADYRTHQMDILLQTYVEQLDQEMVKTNIAKATENDSVAIIKTNLQEKMVGVALSKVDLELKRLGVDLSKEELSLLRTEVENAFLDLDVKDSTQEQRISAAKAGYAITQKNLEWFTVDKVTDKVTDVANTVTSAYRARNLGKFGNRRYQY